MIDEVSLDPTNNNNGDNPKPKKTNKTVFREEINPNNLVKKSVGDELYPVNIDSIAADTHWDQRVNSHFNDYVNSTVRNDFRDKMGELSYFEQGGIGRGLKNIGNNIAGYAAQGFGTMFGMGDITEFLVGGGEPEAPNALYRWGEEKVKQVQSDAFVLEDGATMDLSFKWLSNLYTDAFGSIGMIVPDILLTIGLTAVTAPFGGEGALVGAAKTGQTLVKASNILKKTLSVSKNVAQRTKAMKDFAKAVNSSTRTAYKSLNKVQQAVLKTTPIVSRAGESYMEAIGTYDSMFNDLRSRGYSVEEAKSMASAGAKQTYLSQMPLAVLDVLQVGSILGAFGKKSLLRNSFENFAIEGTEETYQAAAGNYAIQENDPLEKDKTFGQSLSSTLVEAETWHAFLAGGIGGAGMSTVGSAIGDKYGEYNSKNRLSKFSKKQFESFAKTLRREEALEKKGIFDEETRQASALLTNTERTISALTLDELSEFKAENSTFDNLIASYDSILALDTIEEIQQVVPGLEIEDIDTFKENIKFLKEDSLKLKDDYESLKKEYEKEFPSDKDKKRTYDPITLQDELVNRRQTRIAQEFADSNLQSVQTYLKVEAEDMSDVTKISDYVDVEQIKDNTNSYEDYVKLRDEIFTSVAKHIQGKKLVKDFKSKSPFAKLKTKVAASGTVSKKELNEIENLVEETEKVDSPVKTGPSLFGTKPKGKVETSPTNVESKKSQPKASESSNLDLEAKKLLNEIDFGGFNPTSITDDLKKIAKNNNIAIEPSDTVDDVIDKIRAKSAQTIPQTTPQTDVKSQSNQVSQEEGVATINNETKEKIARKLIEVNKKKIGELKTYIKNTLRKIKNLKNEDDNSSSESFVFEEAKRGNSRTFANLYELHLRLEREGNKNPSLYKLVDWFSTYLDATSYDYEGNLADLNSDLKNSLTEVINIVKNDSSLDPFRNQIEETLSAFGVNYSKNKNKNTSKIKVLEVGVESAKKEIQDLENSNKQLEQRAEKETNKTNPKASEEARIDQQAEIEQAEREAAEMVNTGNPLFAALYVSQKETSKETTAEATKDLVRGFELLIAKLFTINNKNPSFEDLMSLYSKNLGDIKFTKKLGEMFVDAGNQVGIDTTGSQRIFDVYFNTVESIIKDSLSGIQINEDNTTNEETTDKQETKETISESSTDFMVQSTNDVYFGTPVYVEAGPFSEGENIETGEVELVTEENQARVIPPGTTLEELEKTEPLGWVYTDLGNQNFDSDSVFREFKEGEKLTAKVVDDPENALTWYDTTNQEGKPITVRGTYAELMARFHPEIDNILDLTNPIVRAKIPIGYYVEGKDQPFAYVEDQTRAAKSTNDGPLRNLVLNSPIGETVNLVVKSHKQYVKPHQANTITTLNDVKSTVELGLGIGNGEVTTSSGKKLSGYPQALKHGQVLIVTTESGKKVVSNTRQPNITPSVGRNLFYLIKLALSKNNTLDKILLFNKSKLEGVTQSDLKDSINGILENLNINERENLLWGELEPKLRTTTEENQSKVLLDFINEQTFLGKDKEGNTIEKQGVGRSFVHYYDKNGGSIVFYNHKTNEAGFISVDNAFNKQNDFKLLQQLLFSGDIQFNVKPSLYNNNKEFLQVDSSGDIKKVLFKDFIDENYPVPTPTITKGKKTILSTSFNLVVNVDSNNDNNEGEKKANSSTKTKDRSTTEKPPVFGVTEDLKAILRKIYQGIDLSDQELRSILNATPTEIESEYSYIQDEEVDNQPKGTIEDNKDSRKLENSYHTYQGFDLSDILNIKSFMRSLMFENIEDVDTSDVESKISVFFEYKELLLENLNDVLTKQKEALGLLTELRNKNGLLILDNKLDTLNKNIQQTESLIELFNEKEGKDLMSEILEEFYKGDLNIELNIDDNMSIDNFSKDHTQIDIVSSASSRVKLLLNSITKQVRTESGRVVVRKGVAGLPLFHSETEVLFHVRNLLEREGYTFLFDKDLSELFEKYNNNPVIFQVGLLYENLSDVDKASFQVVFENIPKNFLKTVLTEQENGEITTRTVNVTNDSKTSAIVSNWQSSWETSGLFDGNNINANLAKELLETIDKDNNVVQVLEALGIKIHPSVINDFNKKYYAYDSWEDFLNKGFLNSLKTSLLQAKKGNIPQNIFTSGSYVNVLANAQSKYETEIVSKIIKDGGKPIFPYTPNSYSDVRIKELKDIESLEKELANDPFSKNSRIPNKAESGSNFYIRAAKLNPEVTEKLELFSVQQSKLTGNFFETTSNGRVRYISGYKDVPTKDGKGTVEVPVYTYVSSKKFTSDNEVQNYMFLLSTYLSNNTENVLKNKVGGFNVKIKPMSISVLSDKDKTVMANVPTIEIAESDFKNNKISNKLYSFIVETVIQPEISRIVEAMKNSGFYSENDLKFYEFGLLNDTEFIDNIQKLVDSKPNDPNVHLEALRDNKDFIMEVLNTSLNEAIISDDIIESMPIKTQEKLTTVKLLEFEINNILTKTFEHQNLTQDMALYTSERRRNKRMSAFIAPRIRGRWEKGSTKFVTIVSNDFVTAISNIQYVLKINGVNATEEELSNPKQLFIDRPELLKFKDLFEVKTTDASEYTTAIEHLEMAKSQGTNMIKSQRDYEIAKEALLNGADIPQDLLYIFNPHKPVYTGSELRDNRRTQVYVKSGSIPLLPQFTKGLAIDNLRIKMEELSDKLSRKQAKRTGLQNAYVGVRATYDTATKLGRPKSETNFWNKDNTFNEAAFDVDTIVEEFEEGLYGDNRDKGFFTENQTQSFLIQDRKFHGIQQLNPFKPDKYTKGSNIEIVLGVQLRSIILGNGISGITEKFANLDGEMLNGQELAEVEKNQLKIINQANFDILRAKLGLDENLNIKNEYSFLQGIIELVKTTSFSRDLTIAEKQSLEVYLDELNDQKGYLSQDLPLMLDATRFENAIKIVIKNGFDIKVAGSSSFVASSAGFTSQDVSQSDIIFTSTDSVKNGIFTGPQGVRKSKETVMGFQDFLSNHIKDC